jgi:hypothetical protein
VQETRLGRRSAADTKQPTSTVLSIEEDAIIVAFCRHTCCRLTICLYALQATIPHAALISASEKLGMRVPVERDHGFRRKMITESGGR